MGSITNLLEAGMAQVGISWGLLSLATILKTMLMVVVGIVAIRVVMNFVEKMLDRSKNLISIRVYIKSSIKIGLFFMLTLVVLDSVGVNITSFIALFSVAGLAVSLALQNTLSNLAGGLQVLLAKPFEVGDFVDTEKGTGSVEEIGLVYSKLVTLDNKVILIPNSQMAASKIQNYTAKNTRRVDITISASYDAPVQNVRAAVLDAVGKFPQVKADPAVQFIVTEYGSSAISYTVRAWVDTAEYWPVHNGIMEELRPAFERHGVEMTYDHLNVHMIQK